MAGVRLTAEDRDGAPSPSAARQDSLPYPCGANSVQGHHGRLRRTQNVSTTTRMIMAAGRGSSAEGRLWRNPRHSVWPVHANPNGSISTRSGFRASALAHSQCASACTVRPLPQPGQSKPVATLSGHGGYQTGGREPISHTANPAAVAASNNSQANRRGLTRWRRIAEAAALNGPCCRTPRPRRKERWRRDRGQGTPATTLPPEWTRAWRAQRRPGPRHNLRWRIWNLLVWQR